MRYNYYGVYNYYTTDHYGNPNVTKLPNSNSNVQNANSRVQKVKTANLGCNRSKLANSRMQKYRDHGSCKISILLCSTNPFQNLEVPCMGMWVTWNWSGYWNGCPSWTGLESHAHKLAQCHNNDLH